MEYFFNQLINGLCQGSIYALMAIGYSVIVGVVGMVTFTYGEVMMIGAFSAYYVFLLANNNLVLAIIAAFAGSFIIGIFVYKLCYERFFNAPRHISLLCTIGMSMLIKNLAQIVFGPETKPVLNIIDNKTFTFHIFGINLDIKLLQIVIIALVIIFAVALTLFFNKTKWGIALRAVSQNKDAAYMMGINVKRTAMVGNCIGCGFGGIAGILLAIYYYSVSATMGASYSMKAFASSVLGGLVDIRFSALGGLCIGLIENIGITISSATFRDIFAFGFLIIILLVRPQGFVSKKGVRV
ncbi:branched-chain amino acid ABC transporter permease [Anaerolentibacter hominis]|uniref:branched-chain amino acid ABC transporter permease n=1 Tax=Anaerolentibacter hominis TaxID=3079009 RepID=UPI0031B87377